MKADDLLLFTKRDEKGEPMGFESGLKIRDYIAIQNFASLISGASIPEEYRGAKFLAEKAYLYADALIAESEKK
jgi:hypothetical protein